MTASQFTASSMQELPSVWGLPLRRLSRDDIIVDGELTPLAHHFLDPQIENLASFPSAENLLARIDPAHGAIYFIPNGADAAHISMHTRRTVGNVPGNINHIVQGKHDPVGETWDCNTYYSIISRESAPKGIARDFLLAADVCEKELCAGTPSAFTLSPMLKFAKWVADLTNEQLNSDAQRIIGSAAQLDQFKERVFGAKSVEELARLANDSIALRLLAAEYVTRATVQKEGKQRVAYDVAGFHMVNGAEAAQLNPQGDPDRIEKSLCYMVNFRYGVADLTANAAAFRSRDAGYLNDNYARLANSGSHLSVA